MDIEKLAKKLKGLQTVSSISKILGIGKKTSIDYIYRLRKEGYLKTSYGYNKIRRYEISPLKSKELGYEGLYDIINKYSKIKLFAPFEHKLHTHKLSVEETIMRAVDTRDFRTVLAALGLFNKVTNWKKLHEYAKKYRVEREVGALYDTARTIIKVRRMDKRIRESLLKSKIKNRYIIKSIKTKSYQDIETLWKVHIPFNRADLMRYKE